MIPLAVVLVLGGLCLLIIALILAFGYFDRKDAERAAAGLAELGLSTNKALRALGVSPINTSDPLEPMLGHPRLGLDRIKRPRGERTPEA